MTKFGKCVRVVGLAVTLASLCGAGPTAGSSAGTGQSREISAALPAGLPTYTGTLDPIFWRALPPADRPFRAWEKWAINKAGRPALPVDVSAVAAKANALANRPVKAFGRYATYVDPETKKSTRYFIVVRLEPADR